MVREYFDKKLVEYWVEFIEKNDDNIYNKEWYYESVAANNSEQAIEFLKDEIYNNCDNPDKYIYTVKGIEKVKLFWCDEVVRVYIRQKPIFDEDTGYYLFKTEDGAWIGQDEAIGEWVEIIPKKGVKK